MPSEVMRPTSNVIKTKETRPRERRLLYAIYIGGILALLVFFVTKSERLMERLTVGEYSHGDLYRFAQVKRFKAKLPDDVPARKGQRDPAACDVLVSGDSFFEFKYGHAPFPEVLEKEMGRSVYFFSTVNQPAFANPFNFFKQSGIKADKERIFLLEHTERHLVRYFSEPLVPEPSRTVSEDGPLKRWQERWITKTEKNYEYFFKHSDLTAPFMEVFSTALFEIFGIISRDTPVYSKKPSFLFFREEVSPLSQGSFYWPHDDALVKRMADNIEKMKNDLRSIYNVKLVFLPVPNKYTIYSGLVNDDPYDDFLPRLTAELEKRGVMTVNIYEKYKNSEEILYYPQDSHWNLKGFSIAMDEAKTVLAKAGLDGR